MTDLDLDKLARRTPPAPDADARARAFASAMQAFDDAEKKLDLAQGSIGGGRRSSMFNRIWSPIMNRRLLAGSALATLLVVPVAGLVTYELVRNGTVALTSETEIAAKPTDQDLRLRQVEEKKSEPNTGVAGSLKQDEARVAKKSEAKQPAELSASAGTADTAQATNTLAVEPAPLAESSEEEAVAAVPDSYMLGGAATTRALTRTVVQPSATADAIAMPTPVEDRERFSSADANPVKSVTTDPVSTFSIDVDTASYSFVRRSLKDGVLPQPDTVRVEEMVNYFPYDWKGPNAAETPFNATVSVMPAPWNAEHKLMHVAIKGYDMQPAVQPKANLVFLIDVSGSMDEPDKLPLLKSAFRLLVNKLKADDTVSIVTYAGNAGTVLEPTQAGEKDKILRAIDNLAPGGSTAGEAGIREAYRLAQKSFVKGGINRVMLATDGDFNVGQTDDDDLKRLIEKQRETGVFLSVFGFGRGNLNDQMMQTIAQNGNGTAAYIDTLAEAEKVLVEGASSTLFPIAKDVKIQVEFNPAKVSEYRLIGYETRALNREDFNNDRVDAGEIGSGHSVTAIYELTPKGSSAVLNDTLRYGKEQAAATPAADGGELAFLKMRWKKPDSDTSELVTMPVTDANAVADVNAASTDVRFSVAVAAFGQKLKGVSALQDYAYGSILGLAQAAKGEDPFGYRAEFLKLVQLAGGLSGEKAQ
jgi:Ca-activated chloride channel family protein